MDFEYETTFQEKREATPATKRTLLNRVQSAAGYGHKQSDGSRDIHIERPIDSEDAYLHEIDITQCPTGELSIDETNELLALMVYGFRERSTHKTQNVYYMYHFIDTPEEVTIIKTRMDDSEEAEDLGRVSMKHRELYERSESIAETEARDLIQILERTGYY